MPIRPIRRSDLKSPVPPLIARRPRALPPPLPAPAARQPMLNWKPIVIAGSAAFAVIVVVLAWAKTHPANRTRGVPFTTPSFVATADRTPRATTVQAIADVRPEPDAPALGPLPVLAAPVAPDLQVLVDRLAEKALEPEAAPVCETLGTSVEFDSNTVRAAKQAAKMQKLLMVLHVSGNFEDAGFT